ncbi:LnmK family bifunctional acyltransferase/decarboxylase [Micromonospora matsumotoense]|uniref:LnmK family bifunctional acyltransferase/decarboxylase n=1 Tax=Micromonospora matsumotoense TaxID=121616 RepID=UPI003F541BAC
MVTVTVLAPMVQARTEVVWPSMCGHNSLFVGRIGDWTWDAVGAACGIDVMNAHDSHGHPAYLSFCYFRIRGNRRFHLRTPTFGDRLCVDTALYRTRGQSVLALHRIDRSTRPPGDGFDLHDFVTAGDADRLYVQTLNRWVARSREGSNRQLRRALPSDFALDNLPEIPPPHCPLPMMRRARMAYTLRPPEAVPAGKDLRVDYQIDPSRDLNGVGLLYFASYFSIVDWALLRWWRRQRRTDETFLGRVVVDQQVCYLANVDASVTISADVRAWRPMTGPRPHAEFVEVVLRDGQRRLVVSTLEILTDDNL